LFKESEVSELPALLDTNQGKGRFTDPQIDRKMWIDGLSIDLGFTTKSGHTFIDTKESEVSELPALLNTIEG